MSGEQYPDALNTDLAGDETSPPSPHVHNWGWSTDSDGALWNVCPCGARALVTSEPSSFLTDDPQYHVGDHVLIASAFHRRDVAAIIRSFRWGEDGEDLVVVDLDPPTGRAPMGIYAGWVFDQRKIIGRVKRP